MEGQEAVGWNPQGTAAESRAISPGEQALSEWAPWCLGSLPWLFRFLNALTLSCAKHCSKQLSNWRLRFLCLMQILFHFLCGELTCRDHVHGNKASGKTTVICTSFWHSGTTQSFEDTQMSSEIIWAKSELSEVVSTAISKIRKEQPCPHEWFPSKLVDPQCWREHLRSEGVVGPTPAQSLSFDVRPKPTNHAWESTALHNETQTGRAWV